MAREYPPQQVEPGADHRHRRKPAAPRRRSRWTLWCRSPSRDRVASQTRPAISSGGSTRPKLPMPRPIRHSGNRPGGWPARSRMQARQQQADDDRAQDNGKRLPQDTAGLVDVARAGRPAVAGQRHVGVRLLYSSTTPASSAGALAFGALACHRLTLEHGGEEAVGLVLVRQQLEVLVHLERRIFCSASTLLHRHQFEVRMARQELLDDEVVFFSSAGCRWRTPGGRRP
jgi:hypothetical protein